MATYFATAARGIEVATAAELARLGAENIRPTVGGVHFDGDRALLYRANLWLRTASRILCPLREFAAANPEMLYSQTRRVRWEEYLNPHKTLAVQATIQGTGLRSREGGAARGGGDARGPRGKSRPESRQAGPANRASPSQGITHSKYAALKIKDAIVDRLRNEQGARPNVNPQNPDILIHAHFAEGRCTLSLDSSGPSLHERGYRLETTDAPLKETLAAAIIELTGWDGTVPLVDPMCGSGTLLIEAAMKAVRFPPGMLRPWFGFQRWPDFDPELWEQILLDARNGVLAAAPAPILGSDRDRHAIDAARANAERAHVGRAVQFHVGKVQELQCPSPTPGVIVTNPPYGERLGDAAEVTALYRTLGRIWQEQFGGWTAYFLAGNLKLAREIGLEAHEKWKLLNGPLECRLLRFDL